jgi:hypothetical protein
MHGIVQNMYIVLGLESENCGVMQDKEHKLDSAECVKPNMSKICKKRDKCADKDMPVVPTEFPLGVRARSESLSLIDEAQDLVEEASKTRRLIFRALVATESNTKQLQRKRDVAWPYVQKGLVSGLIYMIGEAISCGLFSRGGNLGVFPDALFRTSVLHSTLIGMFANGPMLHLFFEIMDRCIKFKSSVVNVILKVLVDQVIWGVIWNFSYILLMNVATDSPGFGYLGEGLGMDFLLDLYKGWSSAFRKAIGWKLHAKLLTEGLKMLPMDIVCYWLVPLRLRAIWVVSVDVFWVTILSRYD